MFWFVFACFGGILVWMMVGLYNEAESGHRELSDEKPKALAPRVATVRDEERVEEAMVETRSGNFWGNLLLCGLGLVFVVSTGGWGIFAAVIAYALWGVYAARSAQEMVTEDLKQRILRDDLLRRYTDHMRQ